MKHVLEKWILVIQKYLSNSDDQWQEHVIVLQVTYYDNICINKVLIVNVLIVNLKYTPFNLK